jgi:hypothetical protein
LFIHYGLEAVARVAGKDPKHGRLSGKEREERTNEYVQQALRQPERSYAARYYKVPAQLAYMEQDPNLNPIRKNLEFAKFWKKVHNKAEP